MSKQEQKTSVLLGPLTKALPRGRAQQKRVVLLIAKLNERIIKRGSIVPKIFIEEQLYDTDKIVVDGENSWTDAMANYVASEFKDSSVERINSGRTEIYVPVRMEGIITSSPWTDLLANLSVSLLCIYLLYYFVNQ